MSVLASDTFSRADGDLGANYVKPTNLGDVTISGGVVIGVTDNTDSVNIFDAIPWANDQWSEIEVVEFSSPSRVCVYVRCSADGNDVYQAECYPGAITIWKRVAGSWASVGTSAALTLPQRSRIRLEVVGTALRCFANGALVVSGTNGEVTSGKPGPGVFVQAGQSVSGCKIESWMGGDFLNVERGADLGRLRYPF